MRKALIAGAGNIGKLIACLLADSKDYTIHLIDLDMDHFDPTQLGQSHARIKFASLNVQDKKALSTYVKQHDIEIVVSCLPYFCNINVAEVAASEGLHYFDLTEDITVSKRIAVLAQGANTIFAPQCGLAPGFISIVAHDLAARFDTLDTVLLRVGALPVLPNNVLKYALTWSTDGLINEYGNPCYAIQDGKEVLLQPLEGLETIQLDGLLYEAFNTSGGLGSLFETYQGKVRNMNYKTLRYPGHCRDMHFLMMDLKLNADRGNLKRILEASIPKTTQDVVLIYVAVKGVQNGQYIEEVFAKKVYPHTISGKTWSAIQVTTAAGVCGVLDILLQNSARGLMRAESVALPDFLNNRFGKYYQ